MVFHRALSSLPASLREALVDADLTDPVVLWSFPGASYVRLGLYEGGKRADDWEQAVRYNVDYNDDVAFSVGSVPAVDEKVPAAMDFAQADAGSVANSVPSLPVSHMLSPPQAKAGKKPGFKRATVLTRKPRKTKSVVSGGVTGDVEEMDVLSTVDGCTASSCGDCGGSVRVEESPAKSSEFSLGVAECEFPCVLAERKNSEKSPPVEEKLQTCSVTRAPARRKLAPGSSGYPSSGDSPPVLDSLRLYWTVVISRSFRQALRTPS